MCPCMLMIKFTHFQSFSYCCFTNVHLVSNWVLIRDMYNNCSYFSNILLFAFCLTKGLAVLDGHIYAVAGWEGQQRLDSIERYNTATNTWQQVAPLTLAVTSPAVAAHNGQLYVTGI